MPKNRISNIAATARPPFLILTPCCLLLAVAYAWVEQNQPNMPNLVLIFIGALSAHISVNMLNEYQDFMSGLDQHTQRTAFSGGSGALLGAPELAPAVKRLAFLGLALTAGIGVYFVSQGFWGLLILGLLGEMIIYYYTDQITHNPWLCLISPGLAFGPLMINGAYYVLTGHYNIAVFSDSLIVFFLVNNLLLLNQLPDVEADKAVGRHHLPIILGNRKSVWVYIGFLAAAYAMLIVNFLLGFLPPLSLIGLSTLFLAIPSAKTALGFYDDIENLKPALGMNVAVTLATPVLVSLGIVLNNFF